MRVLSLFDGISCGQVALHRAGINPSIYFASEIAKHAIAVTQHNFPTTIQLGDVRNIVSLARCGALGSIDLLLGGSPCQGFSKSGTGLGFVDPRSQLLFEYLAIKAILNPRWFLLENVKLSVADVAMVTMLIGVEPVLINSNLFSGQNRVRMYWTNIPLAAFPSDGGGN